MLRYSVAFVCAYEVSAILTRRHPTVSSLCWQKKALIPVIVGGLTAHLLVPPHATRD